MTNRRHFRSILLRAGLIAASFGALSAPASADTTYTYTAPWSSWMDSSGLNRALYAGLDGSGVVFDFTVSAPLISVGCGTNPYSIYCQTDVKLQIQSWHYHGGSSFLNIGSDVAGSVLSNVLLSTDGLGNILNDRFYLHGPVVIPGLTDELSSLYEAHDGYDQQNLFSTYARPYQNSMISLSEGMSNSGGSWSFATTESNSNPIPEPASGALLLVSLSLAGAAARRRNAKST